MGPLANDPAQSLANLLQTGQDMMGWFVDAGTREKAERTQTVFPLFDIAAATQQFELQFIQQMTAFWTGALDTASPAEDTSRAASAADKRFAGEAWSKDPRYDLMRRTMS